MSTNPDNNSIQEVALIANEIATPDVEKTQTAKSHSAVDDFGIVIPATDSEAEPKPRTRIANGARLKLKTTIKKSENQTAELLPSESQLESIPVTDSPPENNTHQASRPRRIFKKTSGFAENNSDNLAKSTEAAMQDISFAENGNHNVMDISSEEESDINTAPTKILSMTELREKSLTELLAVAAEYGVYNTSRMLRPDIVCAIVRQASHNGETIYTEGVLEVVSDGFGFLRSSHNNYVPSPDDIYISQNQVKRFGLRAGDYIAGYARDPKRTERYFSMPNLLKINGHEINQLKHNIHFDNLGVIHPKKKLNLDLNIGTNRDISTRVIDLIAPIGLGQRALIVAPPRTGKTVLMHNIAHAININHPNVKLIVLLVDERPEEVTDMKRSVRGEVVSSTFDEPADRHVALAEIVIAKAKRMVEDGLDVVILLDSITRLARAYNAVVPSSGKVLTGGVDANALQRPKRFFGAARNTELGGSLTIIATALVDTGSKMDEVIFEEFKGTGNSEIVLDRKLSDRRMFPAIDIMRSGTRKEEEMIDQETLSKMWVLRRIVTKMNDQVSSNADSMDFLLKKIKETENNIDFFANMNS